MFTLIATVIATLFWLCWIAVLLTFGIGIWARILYDLYHTKWTDMSLREWLQVPVALLWFVGFGSFATFCLAAGLYNFYLLGAGLMERFL